MEKTQKFLRNAAVLVLVASVSVIVGILFASKMHWTDETIAEEEITPSKVSGSIALNERGESPFVAVAEKLKPAVVSISTTREENVTNPFDLFDFGPFGNLFPDSRRNTPPQQRKVRAGGTGIIISEDGYILTNNHIVDKSEEINVRLSTDEEYEAEIVGADPVTDIALIKIKAKLQSSQVAELGDSEKIKIGDWAVAIGNPFGLENTVTVGVVSALGRGELNIAGGGPPVQYFIQTDASINFGNSGGPLCNIRGQVIGVNTAINTQGQGIGFAIPINMAKDVAQQLREHGRVSHGYLGMIPMELTMAKKEALGLDSKVRGVFVDHVEKKTPADEGGLEPGDVITEFDGVEIKSVPQFRRLVASKNAGDKVTAKALRKGKSKDLTFKLGDRSEYFTTSDDRGVSPETWLGITVGSLRSHQAQQWNIEESEGALVVNVERGSPAEDALQPGDVIIEIDRRPVKDVKDFNQIAEDLKDRKKSILFRISRNGRKTFQVIKP